MDGDFSLQIGGCRVRVTAPCREIALDAVSGHLQRGEGFTLATLNLDHIVKLRDSAAFRRAYAEQSIVVADGNPVCWLSALAGRRVSLVPGSDLVVPLARAAAAAGQGVALVGATESTLAGAAARLGAEVEGIEVALMRAPSMGFDPEGAEADGVIEAIGRSGAGLCLLALGAPRQEIFAARAARALPHVGFASIGAGLDFVAGSQRRAPPWVRRIAMEWAWRMLREPRRLAGRYLRCAAILPGLAVDCLRLRGPGSA